MNDKGTSIGFLRVSIMDADSPERCEQLSEKALRNLAAASLYFAGLCDSAGRTDWAKDARQRA